MNTNVERPRSPERGITPGGGTLPARARTAARRTGMDPDTGLTYEAMTAHQRKLKADAAARRAARKSAGTITDTVRSGGGISNGG